MAVVWVRAFLLRAEWCSHTAWRQTEGTWGGRHRAHRAGDLGVGLLFIGVDEVDDPSRGAKAVPTRSRPANPIGFQLRGFDL